MGPLIENIMTQNDVITVTEKVMEETLEDLSGKADVSVVDDCRNLEIKAEDTGEVIDSTNDIDVAESTCAVEAERKFNTVEVDKADYSGEQVAENVVGQATLQDDSNSMLDGSNGCDTDLLPFDQNLSAIENL